MLILPIKKQWFDMILLPEEEEPKRDEYREIKPYWGTRFAKVLGFPDHKALDEALLSGYVSDPFPVIFRNGYQTFAPACKAEVRLAIGAGKTKWGAVTGRSYYKLLIQKRPEMITRKKENRS